MHREESERLASCVECGATVAVGPDRSYSFGLEAVLCWDCSLRRGGQWCDEEDRWKEPPRVADLLAAEPERG